MERLTKLTAVLSWFNLVIASIIALVALVSGLAAGNMLYLLMSVLLASAIILHSYAALQLRKSIVAPQIPLAHQTPVGIRFMGYVSLFFACMNLFNSVSIIQHTPDFISQVKLPPGSPKIDLIALLRGVSVFAIFFSLTIIFNVILNFRLLRWYLFHAGNDKQEN